MASCCSDILISGLIKGLLVAGISLLMGYLLLALGAPFYLFLLGAAAIAATGILAGLGDLAATLLFGLIANWVVFGQNLISAEFESLVKTNLESALVNPPDNLNLLIGGWIFISVLSILIIPLYFIKPGPDAGIAFLLIPLAAGAVVGLVFFFVFQDSSGPEILKAMAIYGLVVGFIGGMIPGSPL